ncbi:protein GVQW3-like [Oratosquilla oratoria]|uniref:protein GVQW3-like n=1 Tax=Oratosquilla oratoria TaxID=337810 RepID=UPI003F76124D
MQGNMELRNAIKFCVKLKKTRREAYGMLKEDCGDEQMSQASFYRRFYIFSEGNEQVEDEPRPGTPKSARKEENIEMCRLLDYISLEALLGFFSLLTSIDSRVVKPSLLLPLRERRRQ